MARPRFILHPGAVDAYVEKCRSAGTQPQVTEFAATLNVSRVTLNRMFLERFGVTPSHYFAAIRHLHTLQLLEDPSLSLEEVARRAGHGSPRNLFRAFRARAGITPARFRARRRA